jgi:hypothetical protein
MTKKTLNEASVDCLLGKLHVTSVILRKKNHNLMNRYVSWCMIKKEEKYWMLSKADFFFLGHVFPSSTSDKDYEKKPPI